MSRRTKRYLQPPRPDAPAWVHRAWKRIAEDGLSINKAAKGEGKNTASLRRYICTGDKERVDKNIRTWRENNPERHLKLARESQDRRRAADPEGFKAAKLASQRAWGRKPENRGKCQVCGGPMGIDNPVDGTCRGCRKDAAEVKRRTIEKLWGKGKSLKEIASVIGTSKNALCTTMAGMRKSGNYSLPHRYKDRSKASKAP